jgi:pyruvate dehydrogenase E1 component alpha subunit
LSKPNLEDLYREMFRSRLFEEAVSALWDEGLISGEMHLGIGEEAIIAGTVPQLINGDAMALDHRGTAAILMRGVEPEPLLLEFLGHPDGLCAGMGGHMHLFSPEMLAASSGIVGSSGPSAVGFALAAQHLRPGSVTLAFFGEGAINEGMLMESLNMAVIWSLPIIFICKDNGWSITTPSSKVTAGGLIQRARAFDMEAAEVDGAEVFEVWGAAAEAIERARQGGGPTFIRATCRHFEGHFSGYQILRLVRKPQKELPAVRSYLQASLNLKGAAVNERVTGIGTFIKMLSGAREESLAIEDDPLRRTRRQLIKDGVALTQLEAAVIDEIHELLERTVP